MAVMNRKKAELWMSMALDGELSPRRVARLEAYLNQHPELMEDRATWKANAEFLRAHCRVASAQTAASAWQDVCRAIRLADSSSHEGEGFDFRLKWASALAALLLLFAGAGVVYRTLQSPAWTVVAEADRTEVEWVETDLPDAMSMVYEDADTGLTVIWVLVTEEHGHAGS